MNQTEPETEKSRIQPWVIYLLAAIICGGFVIGFRYVGWAVQDYYDQSESKRLHVYSRLEQDITLLDDRGKEVYLREMEGKVWIAAYLYTDCPSGCAGIALEMDKIREEFGDEKDFRVASFSLDPEYDTPEKLREFREKHGFESDNWKFYTDNKGALKGYMVDQFKFWAPMKKPEDKRNGPTDLWEHDMRIALVDRIGQVRGFYGVYHPDLSEKFKKELREDIQKLLDEDTKPGGA